MRLIQNYEKRHEVYRQAAAAEHALGAEFEAHGLTVVTEPKRFATYYEEIDECRDNFDLMVESAWGEAVQVEVKQVSTAFTSLSDFPYPTIFVDETYKADVKPEANYVLVSRPTGAKLVVPRSSRIYWERSLAWDSNWGKEITVYKVHKRYAKPFEALLDYLTTPRNGS